MATSRVTPVFPVGLVASSLLRGRVRMRGEFRRLGFQLGFRLPHVFGLGQDGSTNSCSSEVFSSSFPLVFVLFGSDHGSWVTTIQAR